MIEYILQVQDQNMLQVHYSSGANRYVEPDQHGNYNLSRKQHEFMNDSVMWIMSPLDPWGRYHYYYLDGHNPNHAVTSAILAREEER